MGAAVNKRVFTREFKLSAARQLVGGQKRISQVCREHSLRESVVRRWKMQHESSGEEAWTQSAKHSAVVPVASRREEQALLTNRVQELESALGRAHLEIEFLKLALEKKPSLPERASK
jgi:transposase-like protein